MEVGYKGSHKAAKLIVTIVVCVLLIVSKVVALSIVPEILAVVVWFWAVNPLAYLIEKVMGASHEHDII